MRTSCHTAQSGQTGVIPYTYVKITDAKINAVANVPPVSERRIY